MRACRPATRETGSHPEFNIIELAQDAGLLVVLDGRIGSAEYRSGHGTLDAFQRFVHVLQSALAKVEARAEASASDGLTTY